MLYPTEIVHVHDETLAVVKIPTAQPTNRLSSRTPTSFGYLNNQSSSPPSVQTTGQPTEPTGQPTSQPTGPTGQPTSQPTGPTGQPTSQPTGPTGQPSNQPSSQPSIQPISEPSSQPTQQPTAPTGQPTGQPTGPTGQPSSQPTGPSGQPTGQPSMQPSSQPIAKPSSLPSRQPSSQPTCQPSGQPSMQPSKQPSSQPTMQPTSEPSGQPSMQPTSQPSGQPSMQPSSQPSGQPSTQPSGQPSGQPSMQPLSQPSGEPSMQPSSQPSGQPSRQPSGQPSRQPSMHPSSQPSGQPSMQPSSQPSGQPSMQPSSQPSGQPSMYPSSQPSGQPSMQPSKQPSSQPTMQPTSEPSGQPSLQPSSQPSGQPSMKPSSQPSGQPSMCPSSQPSGQPSMQPSSQPSGQPSMQPSSQPSGQPSMYPSSQPSGQPSAPPSGQPSGHPSLKPVTFSPSTIGDKNRPTYSPTVKSSPTPVPTSRPTISITPSIPKIVSIVVTPSSHNATLTIALFTIRDSPGAVFCMAVRKGSVPSTIGEVKSGGTAKEYLTSTKSLTIVIPGLLALASYQTYCYVELSSGLGSNYADVIATSQVFSTSCCHSILFSNAPVSVYGDVSLYASPSSNSDPVTFVFSYYLESAPSQGSIIVTPTITFENGTTSSDDISIISVPSSAEFRSSFSLSRLKGQFYMSTASTVSGTFLVSLIVTGQDHSTFTTATANVLILSNDQPLTAPVLMPCMFDRSGGYLVVAFDKPTDQAGITADMWPCIKLLIFTDANITTCSWTSLSTIKVIFTAVTATSLKPSDTLSVRGGMLRAACRAMRSCSENYVLQSHEIDYNITDRIATRYAQLTSALTVIVQRPSYPVIPSLLVSVPTQIGACNDLFIDLSASTGSGGRPWSSVAWTVLAEIGDTTELTAFLTNNFDHSSNFVTVPRSMLIQTTYSIGVTVTNFLGDSASSSSTVIVSSDPNLPTASILGSLSRTIKASDSLTIPGSAMVSKCGSSYSLGYTWTLTNSSGALLTSKFTSTDPRKYVAPVYSLNAGSFYKVTLNLILLSQNGLPLSSLYTAANIYVKHGNVIAAVRGGYMREVSIDRVLTLDASISSDEDTSTGSEGLLFSWTCTIASLTDFGSSCDFSSMNVATSSSSVFILPANQMVLSTKYIFTVIATSKDGRSASKNVLITALLPGSPVVFSNNTLTKFNLDSVLSIPGTVFANVSTVATWTAYYDGVLVPLDKSMTKQTIIFTRKESASLINYPLAVSPNAFVAGRTYTFRLSAYPVNNPALLAKTEVVLTVNSPPIGGKTSVSPQKGFAFETDFTITSTRWSDDISDYPLSYSFFYQLADSTFTPALTLAVRSPLSYAVSFLPPGLKGGSLIIRTYIIIITGSFSQLYGAYAISSPQT